MSNDELNEIEQALRQAWSGSEPTAGPYGDVLRQKIVRMFERKIKAIRWTTGLFLAIAIAAMVAAAAFLHFATSTEMMIWCALLFIVAFDSTILIKLWYWVITSKMSVLRELKQLELQLAAQRPEEEQ